MKKTKFKRQRNKGQAMTEYLILTALIAIASIGTVQLLGKNVKVQLSNINNALAGKSQSQIKGVQAQQKDYKFNTLDDFTEGQHGK